jgi:hypothetical protein
MKIKICRTIILSVLCGCETWSLTARKECRLRVLEKRVLRRIFGPMRIGEAHTGFWWGNLRERDHLEDPGLDRKIILRWIFKKWDGVMDLIDLAQERDRRWALVNAVMKLRVPQNAGNFLTS